MPIARRLHSLLHVALIVVGLVAGMAASTARAAADLTDLWWNPAEPGWGVTMVQADSFIFATFFLYGADNRPAWYTGQMARDANGNWSGPLYLTSGTYFGAPYNATLRDTTQVGLVSFVAANESTGALSYNVESVAVSKTIQRQTLQTIQFGGTYLGGAVTDVYNCDDNRPVATARRFVDVNASQGVGGTGQINLSFSSGGTCSFNGNVVQSGRLFRIDNATYSCGTGPATVYELKATSLGFEGRWTAPIAGGCTEYGVFSTVVN